MNRLKENSICFSFYKSIQFIKLGLLQFSSHELTLLNCKSSIQQFISSMYTWHSLYRSKFSSFCHCVLKNYAPSFCPEKMIIVPDKIFFVPDKMFFVPDKMFFVLDKITFVPDKIFFVPDKNFWPRLNPILQLAKKRYTRL